MDNRRLEERPAARPRRENSAPGAVRLMGVIHAVFGMVFFLTSLPMLLTGWLFALPFLLAGGFFAVNGLRMALGGNPFARRADRPEERDAERTAGSEALEGPIKKGAPPGGAPGRRGARPHSIHRAGRRGQAETAGDPEGRRPAHPAGV